MSGPTLAQWLAPLSLASDTMRGHAAATERILQSSPPWRELAALAASDHERLDGSGYPEWKVRKSGKAVPMQNGVHRFRVKDGQVVAWFAAEDTQLSVEAVA
jgi:hypothetical protein